MFAKFKSNIFLIFGLYSFELAHGLLNLIREVSSFSTLLISLLLRLIEVEEKEESKKTEKCTLSAQQIYSAYTDSFSFDDHDYGEECIKLEVASARPILETNGRRTEQTDGAAHKAAS